MKNNFRWISRDTGESTSSLNFNLNGSLFLHKTLIRFTRYLPHKRCPFWSWISGNKSHSAAKTNIFPQQAKNDGGAQFYFYLKEHSMYSNKSFTYRVSAVLLAWIRLIRPVWTLIGYNVQSFLDEYLEAWGKAVYLSVCNYSKSNEQMFQTFFYVCW